MSVQIVGRLFGAASIGLVAVAACAAAPLPPVQAPDTLPGDAAHGWPASASQAPVEAADAGPRCPYGALEDPHRGFMRCLTPDEQDGGWLPPSAQPMPPSVPPQPPSPPSQLDAGADAGPPAPTFPAPLVEIGTPKFENGEVGRAEKVMTQSSAEIAKCIANNGGLTGATGSLKVQFLVRARGRAEGVEVVGPKGISPEAATCIRVLLKNRPIGAPTSDPVGVTISISLKAPPK